MEEILFENEVALVLIVKNESRYIGEWLEYHYRIGVDKFYIYDNDSEDRSELLRILDPWIQAGIVDFIDFSGLYRQIAAYNDAIERHRFDCKYMGFIDTDEFIYIKTGQNLPGFLDKHFSVSPKIAGLGINWRIFGSSGKQHYEQIDVIERFTFRATDNYSSNLLIKTISNPRKLLYMSFPHCGVYTLNCGCFDENLNPISENENLANTCDKIQINHYYTKSVEEYIQKCYRGRADCDLGRELNVANSSKLNEIEDLELRNFWRSIKNQSLPHKGDRDLIRMKNLCVMLKNISNLDSISTEHVELLITCYFLIRRLDSISANNRRLLVDFILERLIIAVTSENIAVWDIMLIVISLPEIIESNNPRLKKIIEFMLNQVIPILIEKSRDQIEPVIEMYIRQEEKFLRLIMEKI